MPTRAKSFCSHTPCPNFTPCPDHARVAQRAHDARRGTSASRGYGARWQRLRKMVLARDPICKICNREPSTDADHIVAKPVGRDAMENLRGLCHSCHSKKTVREDSGFGRKGAAA